jgi:hypothetical protein
VGRPTKPAQTILFKQAVYKAAILPDEYCFINIKTEKENFLKDKL